MTYNGQLLNFLAKLTTSHNTGFINPIQFNYYMYRTYYKNNQTNYESLIKEHFKTFEVTINGESHEIELPIKIINDVFIERNDDRYEEEWNYGINDKLLNENKK